MGSFMGTFDQDNWHRDATSIAVRNRIKTRRWGMRVTVYLGVNSGDYVLSYNLNSTNLQDNANWLKVADIGSTWGGGGGGVTGDNGITVTAGNVQLGGALIQDTIITGLGASALLIPNLTQFYVTVNGANSIFAMSTNGNASLTAENQLNFSGGTDLQTLSNGATYIEAGTSIQIYSGADGDSGTGQMTFNGGLGSDIDFNSDNAINLRALNGPLLLEQTLSLSRINISGSGQIDISGDQGVNIESVNAGTSITAFSGDVVVNASTGNIIITTPSFLALSSDGTQLNSSTYLDFATPLITLQGNAAASPTDYFAGDGTWQPIPGGGSVTGDNGITVTAGNVQLGGPLIQDTLINGAGFDLQFGTFATSPLDQFNVYTGTVFVSARDTVSGFATGLQMNGGLFSVAVGSTGGQMLVGHVTGQLLTTTPIQVLRRRSAQNNDVGLVVNTQIESTSVSAVVNGFGGFYQTDIEVSNGTSWIASQESITWQVATAGAEYSQWTKSLTVNHAPTQVWSIVTSPNILHTIAGLVNMPNLPTSSAGLAAGTLWNNSGVLNVA